MSDAVSQAAAFRRLAGRLTGGGARNVTAKGAKKIRSIGLKRLGGIKTSKVGRGAIARVIGGAKVITGKDTRRVKKKR